MKFHVIIAIYNAENWIEDNIHMLQQQTFTDFQCVLIDDMSADNTVNVVRKFIYNDPRFIFIINKEKKYKTRNIVEGIEYAKPDNEDVIVLVDGDDMLANRYVLAKVKDIYNNNDCWMTYGSYSNSEGVRDEICYPYNKKVIIKNSYRSNKWLASHLKTFKYKLWEKLDMNVFHISDHEINRALYRALFKGQFRKLMHWRKIKSSDLLEASGKYIRRVDDKAFTYPMLEMAGEKAVFIEDILYIYRSERGEGIEDDNYGEGKSEKWHTRLIRNILMYKPSYPRLDEL